MKEIIKLNKKVKPEIIKLNNLEVKVLSND